MTMTPAEHYARGQAFLSHAEATDNTAETCRLVSLAQGHFHAAQAGNVLASMPVVTEFARQGVEITAREERIRAAALEAATTDGSPR